MCVWERGIKWTYERVETDFELNADKQTSFMWSKNAIERHSYISLNKCCHFLRSHLKFVNMPLACLSPSFFRSFIHLFIHSNIHSIVSRSLCTHSSLMLIMTAHLAYVFIYTHVYFEWKGNWNMPQKKHTRNIEELYGMSECKSRSIICSHSFILVWKYLSKMGYKISRWQEETKSCTESFRIDFL